MKLLEILQTSKAIEASFEDVTSGEFVSKNYMISCAKDEPLSKRDSKVLMAVLKMYMVGNQEQHLAGEFSDEFKRLILDPFNEINITVDKATENNEQLKRELTGLRPDLLETKKLNYKAKLDITKPL